ncbi:MAG: hypothetical protein ACLQG3_07645 [Terracidiphilus sp.]
MRFTNPIAAALLLGAFVATTRPAPAQELTSATAYSSSQAGLSALGLPSNELSLTGGSGGSGSGQYGNGGGYGKGEKPRLLHNWTFEAGAGFNAPEGNDTPFITWGGNFTVGAGLRFSKRISALLEYQFMDDKLPGAFIAAEGVQAGDAHINSITGSPVIDLFPKKSNGVYLVGGWGYYHKSTNFNDYEEEESYYGYYDVAVTVASITSNQWGGHAGLGLYHRLGGMYGDGKSEVFAEARYTFIHTPPITQTNGLGTTGLIPVTLGVRF